MGIMGSEGWEQRLIDSYDNIADDYAEEFYDELERKPFDRDLLKRFVLGLPRRGPVCDLGCGPGQIAKFLLTI